MRSGGVVPSRICGCSRAEALKESDEGVEEAVLEGSRFAREDEIVNAPGVSGDVVSACPAGELTFPTSVNSSLGRERASATTFALPCKYLMSVVNSEMQAS